MGDIGKPEFVSANLERGELIVSVALLQGTQSPLKFAYAKHGEKYTFDPAAKDNLGEVGCLEIEAVHPTTTVTIPCLLPMTTYKMKVVSEPQGLEGDVSKTATPRRFVSRCDAQQLSLTTHSLRSRCRKRG